MKINRVEVIEAVHASVSGRTPQQSSARQATVHRRVAGDSWSGVLSKLRNMALWSGAIILVCWIYSLGG